MPSVDDADQHERGEPAGLGEAEADERERDRGEERDRRDEVPACQVLDNPGVCLVVQIPGVDDVLPERREHGSRQPHRAGVEDDRAAGAVVVAEDRRREGQEGDAHEEEQIYPDQALIEARDVAEDAVMRHPEDPDDEKTEDEAEHLRPAVEERVADVLGRGGDAELDHEQRDRDRHDRVTEEDQALELHGATIIPDVDAIWRPTAEVLERANVVRLMRGLGVDDYWELVRRSSEEPEWFWPAAIEDMGIEFSQPWERVYDDSRGPEWTTWFVGGKVNIARVCVHDWARRTPDAVAAVLSGEHGDRREWTYAELSRKVTRFAEALLSLGVEPGDRVGIFMPMAPAMAVASHACAHIGAVQLPIFSGFAAPAIAQRLQDAEAKVLLTASHSYRRGREVPMRAIADEAVAESPSVEHVVEWDRGSGQWDVELGPGELPPLEVDSEHPYLLTYTSGTTGKPKGVLHVQGGFLVSIAREVAYQADGHPGDVILFATDMGWIMGPWTVVGGGAAGCSLVFMEGAPGLARTTGCGS